MISFTVLGIPKGQPRPRAFHRGGKVRVYDPGTAEGWKACVALAARPYLPEAPIDGPIHLQIHYTLPRPKSLMRRGDPSGVIPHTKKPDIDNINKATLDALTAIGMWRDDSQICSLSTSKYYAGKSSQPGALIFVDQIPEEDTCRQKAVGERE